ncbi:hypothetical protein DP114_09830 [Brasilonema sennae CENA114]|uniref:Uncharacterized protein n=1 Tax=Brasilonema sennae CENA114 TaxID=415709 RepID=A0A856MES2_9CYAN|nr:hypothetical protein DP114_09830 [Brasilonema sennae CENA114]
MLDEGFPTEVSGYSSALGRLSLRRLWRTRRVKVEQAASVTNHLQLEKLVYHHKKKLTCITTKLYYRDIGDNITCEEKTEATCIRKVKIL